MSRKITQQAVQAFLQGRNFNQGGLFMDDKKYIVKANFAFFKDENGLFEESFYNLENAKDFLEEIEDTYFCERVQNFQNGYYFFFDNSKIEKISKNEEIANFAIYEEKDGRAVCVYEDENFYLIKNEIFK